MSNEKFYVGTLAQTLALVAANIASLVAPPANWVEPP